MPIELAADNSLPYKEAIHHAGEIRDYGIEWTGFLSRPWVARFPFAANDAIRPFPSSFEFVASGAGLSGAEPPKWPAQIGDTVVDGGILWTCRAPSLASLISSIISSTWSADAPVTVSNQQLSGFLATVLADATGVTVNSQYYMRNRIQLANGMKVDGVFLLKIRAGR